MRRTLPIQWIVAGVILVTALVVLFTGFWLTVPRTMALLDEWMIRRFDRVAQVVGDYSVSDLAFDAREESAKNLARLGSLPNVLAAVLYDAKGDLFSKYMRPGAVLEPPIARHLTQVSSPYVRRLPGAIEVLRPLTEEDETYGAIVLRVSTAELDETIEDYATSMVGVAAGLFLLAVIVALVMQRVVSWPVLRLSKATQRVAQSGDWNTRLEESGAREVRLLTRSFNELLRMVALREAQRDQAEAARFAEAELHAMTLRCIVDGVTATDIQGGVTLMNRVAEEMSGWSLGEARGRPLIEVFPIRHPSSGDPLPDPVPEVLAQGRLAPDSPPRALLRSRDGTERLVAPVAAAIRDPQSRVVGAVFAFRDVTEQARLEREVLRAQKLDSLGVLAGGIAHDFNNLLTGVLANVSLCQRLSSSSEPVDQALAEAEKALVRARDLTMQLLTFARGGLPVKKTADIRELIVESATFVLRGSRSRCEFDIPEDLWPVEVDPGQISQVIQNLVLNADQAMPGGGLILIRARNEVGPDGMSRQVRISVQDHGTGIPEHLIERIFDPYFTTKPKGSGLGLATSFSILRHHGGGLTVASRVGEGSTFHMVLPATRTPSSQMRAVPEQPFRGHGRVLVMDDEALIRSVAERILDHLGYEATTASDGDEAVRRFQEAMEAGRPYDCVILDLTVPGGVGGIETLDRLRRLDPDVRAIVSSGYSSDPIMAEYRRHGFRGVVVKPYTVGEIGRVLGEVFAEKGRSPAGRDST